MRLQDLKPDLQKSLFKLKLSLQVREQADPNTIIGKSIIHAYDSRKVTDTSILNMVRDMANDNRPEMEKCFGSQVIEDILNLE